MECSLMTIISRRQTIKAVEVLIQECGCHRLSLLPRAEGTMIEVEVEVEVEDGESKETKRNSSKACSAQKEKRREKMKRKDED